LGSKAVDEILPSLLNDLKIQGDETEKTTNPYALDALREIMQVRSNAVFPILIPTLLTIPITKFNASALSSLITVSGNALNRRLGVILPALMKGLNQQDEAVPEIRKTLSVLLSQIEGADGIHHVMSTLFQTYKDGVLEQKISGVTTLELFADSNNEDFSAYNSDWILNLVGSMNGREGHEMLKASWKALDSLIRRVKKDDLFSYLNITFRAVQDAEQYLKEDEFVPGFCLEKVCILFLR
jgi:hypothetical protein